MHPRNCTIFNELLYTFSFSDSGTVYWLPGNLVTENLLFALAEQNRPITAYKSLEGLNVVKFIQDETIG